VTEPYQGRVAITGASGLVGSALRRHLVKATTIPLVRSSDRNGVLWDPEGHMVDKDGLEGVDAVIHLAGENLAEGRWTAERKARIERSRVEGTRTIAEALATLERTPRVLVSASGVGFYGNAGETPVDERSEPGSGFLAEVCRKWEAASQPAEDAGIRVVHARIGVVLSAQGGALAKMLPAFKAGVGGRLGSGEQYMSWVHLTDLCRIFERALTDDGLAGPVNAVAPEPVPNKTFTSTLGKVLGRPTVMAVPGFALKLGLGSELAEEALLGGQRVVPKKLDDAGFSWSFPTLEEALRDLLDR
jgi:hypothetical protein